ncbi:MAG: hypothetical protein U1F68_15805 [Gammaproteobacteria bacterium]
MSRISPGTDLIARSLRRRVALLAVIVAFSYLALEAIFSTLYVYGWVRHPEPFWVSEDSGRTVQFDPILGYRLTPTPSRVAKISFGAVEFQALLRGNNLGFVDKNDFTARAQGAGVKRIAVMGDSFTAASYLQADWTEAIEHLSRSAGQPLEVLNFAIAGAGLANWWSVITRLLEPQDYQFDGLVFAVFEGDLHRGFSVSDHRGYREHHFGRAPSWNPAEWPRTLDEARPLLMPLRGFILSPPEFEQALAGRWSPPDPAPPWRPYAALKIGELLGGMAAWLEGKKEESPAVVTLPDLNAEQIRLIQDIAAYAQRHHLPVLVASIPGRESLLAGLAPPADVREFAKLLGADFIDGGQAFAGLTAREIRASWLPYDGHWGQVGSDRFAALIWRALQRQEALKP